jgi:chemotaxis protein CheD
MLPHWNGEGIASMKYGNIAIPAIIEKMIEFGSVKKNLQAKIFGGGAVFGNPNSAMNIGESNINIAQSVLAQEQIRIICEDVGGTRGRKIVYDLFMGTVLVRKLDKQIDDIKI